jgi:hypothetical protein
LGAPAAIVFGLMKQEEHSSGRNFRVLATFSRQSEIERYLRNLNCSGRSLVLIAKLLGVSISESKLSEYLHNEHRLAKETEDRVIEVLQRMLELQSAVYAAVGFVEVNWADSQKVADALTARQLAVIARDQGLDENKQFQNLADNAVKQFRQ